MKVLFCAYDAPGLIASGPNAWLQRLIPDLRETYNIDVSVLFIHTDNSEDCPSINFFSKNQLPYHTISRRVIPYVEDQVSLILKLLKENNYQVLVANLVIPAFYAAKYLKTSGIPVVGVIHSNDAFYDSVINKFIAGPKDLVLDRVVTVSNYLKKKSEKVNTYAVPIQVIPCGTPFNASINQKEHSKPFKIVYAGRLVNEQKQVIMLVKSFIAASLRDERLYFTIYGSGAKKDEVIQLIQESHSKNVVYGGAIPPDQIIDKLKEHHVFTLMSDYEGMPIALMEAMSCGLVPVCLSEESGVNEIIQNNENGLIALDRDLDYQEKLLSLLNDPIGYNKLSKEAVDTIAQKYSSKVTHGLWADLLTEIEETNARILSLPKRIRLDSKLLYYGDFRKPENKELILKDLEQKWMKFRLFVRPRARLRSLFGCFSKKK